MLFLSIYGKKFGSPAAAENRLLIFCGAQCFALTNADLKNGTGMQPIAAVISWVTEKVIFAAAIAGAGRAERDPVRERMRHDIVIHMKSALRMHPTAMPQINPLRVSRRFSNIRTPSTSRK